MKLPLSDEPRCPLVPKLTRWLGSLMSGLRSKYSRSSRAKSTSNSFGAGLPASGEIAIASNPLAFIHGRPDLGVPRPGLGHLPSVNATSRIPRRKNQIQSFLRYGC